MARIHKPDRLHYSNLKYIDASPKHYVEYASKDFEASDDNLIGQAVHAWVLLGERPKYWPGRRAGREYTEAVEANGGEAILNQKQYDNVSGMVKAVFECETAMTFLGRCPNRETYIEWDRALPDGTVVKCGGTPDANGEDILVELKTAKSSQWRRFQKEGHWYRYPEQLAWYDFGLGTDPQKVLTGEQRLRDCYTIAVQKTWPYPVSVHRLTPLKWMRANKRIEEWLALKQECERTGYWPGWDRFVRDWDIEDFELDDGFETEETSEESDDE